MQEQDRFCSGVRTDPVGARAIGKFLGKEGRSVLAFRQMLRVRAGKLLYGAVRESGTGLYSTTRLGMTGTAVSRAAEEEGWRELEKKAPKMMSQAEAAAASSAEIRIWLDLRTRGEGNNVGEVTLTVSGRLSPEDMSVVCKELGALAWARVAEVRLKAARDLERHVEDSGRRRVRQCEMESRAYRAQGWGRARRSRRTNWASSIGTRRELARGIVETARTTRELDWAGKAWAGLGDREKSRGDRRSEKRSSDRVGDAARRKAARSGKRRELIALSRGEE